MKVAAFSCLLLVTCVCALGCVGSEGTPVDLRRCLRDNECLAGEHCGGDSQLCLEHGVCLDDGDCAAGEACWQGLCGFTGECTEERISTARPSLAVVLDRSCSMKDALNGDSSETRWEAMAQAVSEFVTAYRDAYDWGYTFFPALFDGANYCAAAQVPVDASLEQSAFNALLVSQQPDAPCTSPVGAGLQVAASSELLSDSSRRNTVLLIADSTHWCVGSGGETGDATSVEFNERAIELIGGMRDDGIVTHVIKVGDLETANTTNPIDVEEWMGRFATAGGTKLQTARRRRELDKSLEAFAQATHACRFPLRRRVENAAYVRVVLGGGLELLRDSRHLDGWDYEDGAIELYGPTCERVKLSPATDLRVQIGCR